MDRALRCGSGHRLGGAEGVDAGEREEAGVSAGSVAEHASDLYR